MATREETTSWRRRSAIVAATLLLAALCVLSILWNAPAVITGTITDEITTTIAGGEMVKQILFVLVFLGVIVTAIASGRVASLVRMPPLLLATLGWAGLSLSWATDPAVGWRRFVFTLIILTTANFTVRTIGCKRTLLVLLSITCVVVPLDLLSVTLIPSAIHTDPAIGIVDESIIGAWRGLHQEKNEAGAVMGLMTLLLLDELFRTRSWRIGPLLVAGAAGFLVGTQSKTSIGFAAAAAVLGGLVPLIYRSRTVAIGASLVGAALAVLGLAYAPTIVAATSAMLADPTSFTGRAEIWAPLFEYASAHFWLGSGFGAYWGIPGVNTISDFGAEWLSNIYEAHDGYLDLMIQTGLVGLVLAIVTFIVQPAYLLLRRPLQPEWPRRLIASLLLFELFRNMLESSILDRANPSWVIFAIAYFALFESRDRASEERLATFAAFSAESALQPASGSRQSTAAILCESRKALVFENGLDPKEPLPPAARRTPAPLPAPPEDTGPAPRSPPAPAPTASATAPRIPAPPPGTPPCQAPSPSSRTTGAPTLPPFPAQPPPPPAKSPAGPPSPTAPAPAVTPAPLLRSTRPTPAAPAASPPPPAA